MDENLKIIQQSLTENQTNSLNLEVGSGLGLLNTHQRIQLAYGNRYRMKIDSKYKERTTISLSIPWENDDGEQAVG
ncbi:sensor histidine kinase [Gracilibacillus alcaliphilus]|uniref:sensor histidine kinase n=1 Tax=Gracilibacillus alcaliphilus TaxID=1401441 RepID=UPI001957257C|nr:hypothetical protein [Gracilibacillus alcaliphilus]MBM7677688.1 sensor histidine kinase YesM [Gracilibacillus alcaliphilus]